MGAVSIGIDVGQRVDPTAICVAEREDDRPKDLVKGRYLIRHLERLPIGTPYPEVAVVVARVYRATVTRVAARLEREQSYKAMVGELRHPVRPHEVLWREASRGVVVLVDATGVGMPVVDLLRAQAGLEDASLTGVFFTSGERCSVSVGAREGSVGKAYLVSRLQALLQSRRVGLPQTAEARALADELLNYEIRVSEAGTMTAGAFKAGTHDDLATALGLATLLEETRYQSGTTRMW